MKEVDQWVRGLVPAVCDVSVTNLCNATCDFCSYARDKNVVRDRRWIERSGLARALPILHRRGIRYLNFQGGEPLHHPEIAGMVTDARAAGMRPALITNGWLLPQRLEALVAAGLGTLIVSIDSHSMAEHERNRGLPGLGERIRLGLIAAREHGLVRLACVTVNRLVDYDQLPDLLRNLGFDAVTFSYPRRERFDLARVQRGIRAHRIRARGADPRPRCHRGDQETLSGDESDRVHRRHQAPRPGRA